MVRFVLPLLPALSARTALAGMPVGRVGVPRAPSRLTPPARPGFSALGRGQSAQSSLRGSRVGQGGGEGALRILQTRSGGRPRRLPQGSPAPAGWLVPGACRSSHPGRCGPCSDASCPGAALPTSFAERVPSLEQGLDL